MISAVVTLLTCLIYILFTSALFKHRYNELRGSMIRLSFNSLLIGELLFTLLKLVVLLYSSKIYDKRKLNFSRFYKGLAIIIIPGSELMAYSITYLNFSYVFIFMILRLL